MTTETESKVLADRGQRTGMDAHRTDHENRLILIPIGMLVLFYLPFILDLRMPKVHDTWEYLILQYTTLNDSVMNGIIPKWFPFMTYGTVTNWWFALQANTTQLIYYDFGRLLSSVNFIPLFYVGILFDEFLLLLGVWLLGHKLYRSVYANLFVAIATVGTSIWVDQIWYNFHLYYAIPLILYLFHVAFEKQSRLYFFLGANLAAFATFGNLPYFVPVTLLTVCAYFAVYFVVFPDVARKVVSKYRFSPWDLVWLVLAGGSFLYVLLILRIGTGEIVNYNGGRTASGAVSSLDSFLTYGGSISLQKYFDAIFRVSFSLDQTLFVGYLTLAFAGIAIMLRPGRSFLVVFIITLILFSFSMAAYSPLGADLFYLFPAMGFFRHLGLTGPLVKQFLIFLGGFGFDAVYLHGRGDSTETEHNHVRKTINAAALMLALFGILAFIEAFYPIIPLEPYYTGTRGGIYDNPYVLKDSLVIAAFFAFASALVLYSWVSNNRSLGAGLAMLLVVFTLDVFGFKFQLTEMKTVELSPKALQVFDFQGYNFAAKRQQAYDANSRFEALSPYITYAKFPGKFSFWDIHLRTDYGAIYWPTDSFLFMDPCRSMFRVDHWLVSFDEFLRASWNLPLRTDVPLPGSESRGMSVPANKPAFDKIAGCRAPKLQLFKQAYLVQGDQETEQFISSPDYAGDVLFVASDSANPSSAIRPVSAPATMGLTASDRVHAGFDILAFDSDRLELRVRSPLKEPSILLYSDAWHPFWKVSVNGVEKPLLRANLGFKAVEIGPGVNVVRFQFDAPILDVLFWLARLNAHLWFVVVGGLFLFELGLGRKVEAQLRTMKRSVPLPHALHDAAIEDRESAKSRPTAERKRR